MSNFEQILNHVYIKDDSVNPEAINLKAKGNFNRIENILIDIPGRFQRISIYENDLIVCEELITGQHIFRFNKLMLK